MKKLIIAGISDTADRIYSLVKRYNLFNIIGFTVDKEFIPTKPFYAKGNNEPIYPLESLKDYISIEEDLVFVAILWNHLNKDRRIFFEKMKSQGYHFANIISPFSRFRGDLMGCNCLLSDGVIVQENVVFGDDIYVMDGALIGHRTHVQNHCFLAIGSTICGSCVIGEQSFIGARATVFDETIIGKKCIIGGGTIIKRNVPAYSLIKSKISTLITSSLDEESIESKLVVHRNVR